MRIRRGHTAIFFLFLLLGLGACTKEEPVGQPYRSAKLSTPMQQWLETLCSKDFHGRKTGSVYDSLTAEYLMKTVRAMGYEPVKQSFRTEAGTPLRNILVTIPGASDSLLVIGAHFDGAQLSRNKSWFPAANDNASGVVALLRFLQETSGEGLKTGRTVLCCFWDGEEVFEGQAFHGSLHFVRTADRGKILLYLNLDTIGHEHESMGLVRSEGEGLDRLITLVSDGMPCALCVHEPYDGSFSDFVPFKSAGIPYLGFHDHYGTKCAHANHSTGDAPAYVSMTKLEKMAGITRLIVENYE